MNKATTLAILSLAAAGAASPQVAFAQRGPDQVVRTTDSEMTCEALTTNINALNEEVRHQAESARRGAATRQTAGRLGRGLLSGLARGAASGAVNMAYGDGGIGGMVASQAVGGVAKEVVNGVSTAPAPATTPAAPTVTPQQQRLTHLTDLHRARPC